MSNLPPASDPTSPGTSVRSSEAVGASQDAFATTPSPEPEEITPTAPFNGSESRSGGTQDDQEHQEVALHFVPSRITSEEYEGSNANTPRLPPYKRGKHHLDSIPAEDTTTLETSISSSEISDLAQSTSHSFASNSSHPISTVFTTLESNTSKGEFSSEECEMIAGKRGFANIETNSRLASDNRDVNSDPSPAYQKQTSQSERSSSGESAASASGGGVSSDATRPKTESKASSRNYREEAFSEQRNRSSSRSSQSRVEKSIEATLAEEAPSSNARSRKSSHMLGLFRENTAPVEGRKTSQNVQSLPDALGDTKWNRSNERVGIEPEDRPAGVRSMTEPDKRHVGQVSAASANGLVDIDRTSSGNSQHETPRSSSNPTVPVPKLTQMDEAAGEGSLKDFISKASRKKQGENTSRKRLPTRLLEEIREHHNLGTPFHDKFRTSQTKPIGQRTSFEDDRTAKLTEPKSRVAENSVVTHEERVVEEHETEDDESDKEQISSALYYPHQAPSPDALQDVNIDEARSKKDKTPGEVSLLPEAALNPGDELEVLSDDVDINLQSRNRSRHLHGDLQQARPSSSTEHDLVSHLEASSSASESETDSLGSSSQTDDAELTPRASPTSKISFFHNKGRKARPAAPLGAVELKPYNHQVGGHTTVFRFSKRAVCKQLTSRENRFYELVEKDHPELLKFLPK